MRAIVVLLALGALVGGCGRELIKQSGAEQAVADLVARQTGFRPTDVKCPAGVAANAGTSFDCRFTGPEGKSYTAHVRILKVQGQRVEFFIMTRPSS